MPLCRKAREGNTGIAMNGPAPRAPEPPGSLRLITYSGSDISAASNSRCRSIRKNVSSTGRLR
jgi:hypothetical protein